MRGYDELESGRSAVSVMREHEPHFDADSRFQRMLQMHGWTRIDRVQCCIECSGGLDMKISISEARKRLPELLRLVQEGGDAAVRITVHDEVVAELRPVLPEPEPGAAARKLLELMEKLPKHKGQRRRPPRTLRRISIAASRSSV